MDIYNKLQNNTKEVLNQILTPDKRGGYVCPVCGNGSGKDGTGLYSKDGRRFKCFVCGFYGDVVDIVGAVFHLNHIEALNKAKALAGGNLYTKDQKALESAPRRLKKDITGDLLAGQPVYNKTNAGIIEQASKDPRGAEYLKGRGIPTLLSRRYKIGYLSAWRGNRGDYLIIPNSRDSFNIRDIGPHSTGQARYRKWLGYERADIPFNVLNLKAGAPVFVTEGEIDALSIMTLGYQAVSINGNTGELAADIMAQKGITGPLIVLMDNDGPGRQKGVELAKVFKSYGLHGRVVGPQYYGGYNDPNALLMGNRSLFREKTDKLYNSFNGIMV